MLPDQETKDGQRVLENSDAHEAQTEAHHDAHEDDSPLVVSHEVEGSNEVHSTRLLVLDCDHQGVGRGLQVFKHWVIVDRVVAFEGEHDVVWRLWIAVLSSNFDSVFILVVWVESIIAPLGSLVVL